MEKISFIDGATCTEVIQGKLSNQYDLALVNIGFFLEMPARCKQHVDVHVSGWSEPATQNEHIFLVQLVRWLLYVTIRSEHCGFCESVLDEFQCHQPVVDVLEVRP